MAASASAALACLVLRAWAIDLSARSEARETVLASPQIGSQTDGEIDPKAAVAYAGPSQRLGIALAPRLMLLDVGNTSQPSLVARGQLDWQAHPSLDWTLGLAEQAAYGKNDFSLLAPAASAEPARLEPVPNQGVVPYVFFNSSARLDLNVSPRLRLSASPGYLISGGADATARAVLPLQQGPSGDLQSWYKLAPLDEVGADASAAQARFAPGPLATVGQLALGWSHRFSRATDFTILLGAGGYATQLDGATIQKGWLPVADGRFAHRFHFQDQSLVASLTARLGPFIDRLTGLAYGRAEGRAGVSWDATRRVRVGVGASATVPVVGAEQGQALALLDSGVTWVTDPTFQLTAGLRAFWTRSPNGDTAGGAAFLAVTFAAEGWRQ